MKADFTFLLEHAAWPAFLVETSGTIRHANQAAIALFGPKLEGETVSLAAIWDDDGETAEQFLARWERTAVAVQPLRFRGRGGSAVTFTAHICPTRESQRRYVFQLIAEHPAGASGLEGIGGAPGAAGAGDTVLIHKQKLDGALRLARTVALDFNNALTSITAYSSLLLALADRGHPWRAALVEMEKAAQKAAEITHQLALFSRQEKDGGPRAAANLNSLLRRVVEILGQSRPKQLAWSLNLEPQLYSAKFDEAKLQQVFMKILENSLEATGEAGRIAISSTNLEVAEPLCDGPAQLAPGSYVRVEISDDGPGIPAAVLPRIFEPFFTTKQGHRGLGLAWVYGIMTNHRGAVAVSTLPTGGASTRLYLPATRSWIADTNTHLEELRGNGDRTILLVDDDDLILTLGHVVLGSFGYRVVTANSGRKALETIDQSDRPFDLVITDLVMPQMSGRDVIEQVQLRLPGVPILCISGLAREVAEGEAFLPKPFTSQELLTRVRQMLTPAAGEVSA